MNINHIKAPEHLKHKTVAMMEEQIKPKSKNRYMKGALIAACIPVLFTLTAFAYVLFSGIGGDELNIDANYIGDGVAQITVENLAEKDLQFDETIKLEQWTTAEEIFIIEQDMPLIKSGETDTITIQIPDEYIERLETPLPDTDWYHFVLTTNNFTFGESWLASLIFTDPIITEKPPVVSPPEIPVEDNTSDEDITTIENTFVLQNPLSQIQVTFDYNDYKHDGEYAHAEVDLVAEHGSDIYSLCEGTVIEVGFDVEVGNYIIIDHKNGLVSKYTHCSELLKEKDDVVSVDDVIATVGKTGMATGAHLGFSVTFNGTPINPQKLFTE